MKSLKLILITAFLMNLTACGDNYPTPPQNLQLVAVATPVSPNRVEPTLRPDIQPDEATAMAKARSVNPTEIMARKETGIAGYNLTAVALTSGPTPTKVVTDPPTILPGLQTITSYEATVNQGKATRDARPGVRETLVAQSTIYALTPPPPTLPPTTPFIGISNRKPLQAPRGYEKSVIIESAWQGYVGTTLTQVLSGHLRDYTEAGDINENQGVILVLTNVGRNSDPTVEDYVTPTIAGSVKFTSYTNNLLTMQSKDGTTFTFDLASRTFLK